MSNRFKEFDVGLFFFCMFIKVRSFKTLFLLFLNYLQEFCFLAFQSFVLYFFSKLKNQAPFDLCFTCVFQTSSSTFCGLGRVFLLLFFLISTMLIHFWWWWQLWQWRLWRLWSSLCGTLFFSFSCYSSWP